MSRRWYSHRIRYLEESLLLLTKQLLGTSYSIDRDSRIQARMNLFLSLIVVAAAQVATVSAFLTATSLRVSTTPLSAFVDIDYNAQRDIATMEEWTAAYGVQRAEGVELTSEDGVDISVMTTQDLPAESPVLFVPAEMILSSFGAMQEIGRMEAAEDRLVSVKASDHVPQFYLFLKILREYELGDESPWFPWLNSLPRYYSNGASMTPFCFDCLPALAGNLAQMERIKYIQFFQALKSVDFLSQDVKTNKRLTKWAFSVVYTRGFETPDGDFKIAPMADMFNHGTETEVEMRYDDDGNAYVYTTTDVPAGSPLRVSYGDPTNPSHLLARYGFLDKSSPATFCKIMISRPSQELINLGYDHSRMLFYKDTGDVSPEVFDVLLYQSLESDPETQKAFYEAHMNGDEETKQAIHEYYYDQTAAALQEHIQTFLRDLEKTIYIGSNSDVNEHPRLPLILSHNLFVKETFEKVQAKLFEYA